MTDESHGIDPVEEPAPPMEANDGAAVGASPRISTSGETLVAYAGILVVAVWVIFSILATEYFVSFIALLLGVIAAVAPRVNRATVERMHPLPMVMKAVGFGLVVVVAASLVEDLRFEQLDEAWAWIGALVFYAAGAMAFIGARQIKV